ncbi:MAG: phospho-N-acetylmuramoyl-pentapeptide-transferase [Chthonomonadales bacterium]
MTAAGFVLAFAAAVLTGWALIPWLARVGIRQTVSADAPARHSAKQGTPTMGGIAILAGLSVPTVIEALVAPHHWPSLVLLGLTLAFGGIGFWDDLLIARRGKNLGLKARHKLALQFVFAAVFVAWLALADFGRGGQPAGRVTVLRLWEDVDLGVWYYPLAALMIVGLSNAVNLADGLDGLAAGVCALAFVGLAAIVAAPAASPMGSLALFGSSAAGACCGFLWYNAPPARVFMGDTGSLALGAALGGMAVLGKAEVPVQFMAAIPWAAVFSVIVQVGVFRYRAWRYGLEYARTHRVFRRTPIHHHFEELGWPETQIVARFWLITASAVASTLAVVRWR